MRYLDLELNEYIDGGTIREVTNERAEQLVKAGVAKVLEIEKEEKKTTTKKATKTTTKKTTKKKASK